MQKIVGLVTMLIAVMLHHSLYPGFISGERQGYEAEGLIEKVNKNGVLERKPKLRSRLNTHLIYKK